MERNAAGLTGNQLKIIAMISMTLDHVGLLFFPDVGFFRILGRLALPIYAYMIAEGCRYTRNRGKYFLRLFGMGLLCQIVYFVAMGSLYQCILITFSLSIALIWLAESDISKGKLGSVWLGVGVLTVFFLCVVLPDLLTGTDFAIDYGIWGVLMPLFVFYGRSQREKLRLLAVGLVLLALSSGGVQWFALAAIPVLARYNGERGKLPIGKLFYLYYPLHMVVLQGLCWLL